MVSKQINLAIKDLNIVKYLLVAIAAYAYYINLKVSCLNFVNYAYYLLKIGCQEAQSGITTNTWIQV
jgi:hypothetical protein